MNSRTTKSRLMAYPLSLIVLLSLAVFPMPVTADEDETPLSLETDAEKFGYASGVQLGRQFRQTGEEMDMKAFAHGFKAAMAEEELEMTDEELTSIMRLLNQRMRERQMADQQRAVTENLEKALAFLEENKDEQGVVTTETGLQYKVLEPAEGATPTAQDTVRVHYRGTLLDGTQFDSSYDRGQPAEFPLGGVIAGWTEGLQHMAVGSKYRFWIHPEMAYGSQGRPGIPPNSLLVFDVELLEIK